MWYIEPEPFSNVAEKADSIVWHVVDQIEPGSIILLELLEYEEKSFKKEESE